jgi:plastocyanin
MTRWLAVLCSLSALALVAAGCGGGDDNKDNGGGGGGAKAPAPAKKKGAGAASAQVTMKNIQFNPASVTVKKGGTVTWTNDDSANHDVTKTGGAGPKFSSGTGNLKKGDTYKQTLKTAGQVKYVCTVHPGMEGTITVK